MDTATRATPDRPPLRIALWQCVQQPGDVAGNLARLAAAASVAAAAGAQLLVTPEMLLTGYAIGADAVQRLATPADGALAAAVADIARQAHIAVVWGFPERDAASGRVHNAAQFVDQHGAAQGTYRKTHLYGTLDRAQFAASAAAPSLVVDWRGWRVGLLICYDIEFPEAVRRLAVLGADLIAVPTANMRGFEAVSRLLVPARALENHIHVAYANCCGAEGPLRYCGLSLVAGPDGSTLAAAGDTPTLLYADLDPPVAADPANSHLHDHRPELYAARGRAADDPLTG